ncbi:MAG: 50S ribosomal protein L17, partial [Candidatus Binatota bacterium]
LMRNLVTSLFRHERIQTTDPKAKELRGWADHVITLGKEGTLHARRQAIGIVQDKGVVRKIFDSLAPRYKDRPGGYTRIVKVGWRHGDCAPLSLVELLPADGAGKVKAEASSGAKKRSRRPAQKGKEGAAKKKPAPRRSAKKATA